MEKRAWPFSLSLSLFFHSLYRACLCLCIVCVYTARPSLFFPRRKRNLGTNPRQLLGQINPDRRRLPVSLCVYVCETQASGRAAAAAVEILEKILSLAFAAVARVASSFSRFESHDATAAFFFRSRYILVYLYTYIL